LLEIVYVGFFEPRITNLGNDAGRDKIATSCREKRRRFSVCVVGTPRREMG
jgi:hypothetical protein